MLPPHRVRIKKRKSDPLPGEPEPKRPRDVLEVRGHKVKVDWMQVRLVGVKVDDLKPRETVQVKKAMEREWRI